MTGGLVDMRGALPFFHNKNMIWQIIVIITIQQKTVEGCLDMFPQFTKFHLFLAARNETLFFPCKTFSHCVVQLLIFYTSALCQTIYNNT